MENENITLEVATWDRTDNEPCKPCYIRINDMGTPQCTECLALYNLRSDRKYIIQTLKELYCDDGNDIGWQEPYYGLVQVKDLVRRKKWDSLSLAYCTYTDSNGKIKTDRKFYEKRREN